MALYDHRGEPVQTAQVKREQAAPKLGTVRTPYRASQAAGLTPSRLAGLLRAADEGSTEAFFTLAEEMEERDLHYRSVLSTRKLGVVGAEIQVEAASDGARDQRVADAVREDITSRPQFEGLAIDLMDAVAKGVSIVEIVWNTKGERWTPERYEWRDQRWFTWDIDGLTAPLLRTTEEPNGAPLAAWKYAVHTPKLKSGIPLRGGVARVALVAFLLKSYSLRDWAAFCEVFGMPIRLGKYDATATAEEKATLLRAVTAIGIDAAATIPKTMELEFIDAAKATGGDKLFQGAADWWDSQVSKLVLGQTMTADNGSSRAQAQVHDDVRLAIRQADARALSATINRDVVAPYVAFNFGANVKPPRIRFAIEEPEDLVAYMQAVAAFVHLGGKVEASVVRDKLGLPDPTGEADLLGPKAPDPAQASPETPVDEPPPERGKPPKKMAARRRR